MRRPGAGGVCRDLCRTNPLAPLHASAHRAAAPRHTQLSCLAANWIFYFLSKPIDICHHHKTIIKIIKEQRWTTDGSVSVQSRDIRCKVALICDSHVQWPWQVSKQSKPGGIRTHWGFCLVGCHGFWAFYGHFGPKMYDFAAISCNFEGANIHY